MRSSFHSRVALEAWARQHVDVDDAEVPDDWPKAFKLPTNGLEPLFQGDYAMGQSAAFAAVNALRLVFAADAPLSSADEYWLLRMAWRWQADRGGSHFGQGLRARDWPRLLDGLCECLSRQRKPYVAVLQPWREHPPSLRAFLNGLERLLVSRHVIMGLLMGAHYSVVRGYTPASLLLFDSAGQYSIRRNSLAMVGDPVRARHRIVATSTLALRRAS